MIITKDDYRKFWEDEYMYCPTCGAFLPDNATMCNTCKTVFQMGYKPAEPAQSQPFLGGKGPAMTYNEPVSPLVQTMGQKIAEPVENKKQQQTQKRFPLVPVLIGSGALVIVAVLVTLIVVFAGKDRGTEVAADDSTESTFGSIGSDITEEEDTSYASAGAHYEEFNIGETWTVDGQWMLTVLGAKKTEERNNYSDREPEVVYIVDYMYTNIGYEDAVMDGVYFSLNDIIIDSKGRSGYSYNVRVINYAQEAPLGATCRAQASIGLDHDGTFKINMTKYDDDCKPHSASFVIDPSKEAYDVELPSVDTPDAPALAIGETWTVDGQWSVTVTGVRETDSRSEYTEKNPEKVYIVEYTYTNLGYEDEIMDGLYIALDDMIIDSAGVMGYSYPGDTNKYPKTIKSGETCTAESCIGVEHDGDFRVSISKYDSEKNKQKETFNIKVN